LIIFNVLGYGMLTVAWVAVIAVSLATSAGFPSELNAASSAIVGGLVLFLWDFRYRQKKRHVAPAWNIAETEDAKRWWFHRHFGGHIFFIPVWMIGCFSIVWALAILLGLAKT
jgi:hypothetical protein